MEVIIILTKVELSQEERRLFDGFLSKGRDYWQNFSNSYSGFDSYLDFLVEERKINLDTFWVSLVKKKI